MKWGKAIDEKGWQDWFAWRPVQLITGCWIWLEWVQRGNWTSGSGSNAVWNEVKNKPHGYPYAYKEKK